ncbi:MAG: hypothetical protein HWQ41_01405 [Nostoc sp. NOS(2021)]|uniref:hypothetical protein n=1 Tax=Nostoc sp. NOS(2021) TaxID=2815407 RepID=UPI0025F92CB3|nr:hypothetical protein [Nostoc sp. NOS(2021)]MBN3893991.1 hypothetical protein [Nostoc sp. NOS(2021)]
MIPTIIAPHPAKATLCLPSPQAYGVHTNGFAKVTNEFAEITNEFSEITNAIAEITNAFAEITNAFAKVTNAFAVIAILQIFGDEVFRVSFTPP